MKRLRIFIRDRCRGGPSGEVELAGGLFWISFLLLFMSSIDDGPVSIVIKLIWAVSFLLLCLIDMGAGFGIYVISIAIYNAKHVLDPGPLWDRVDSLSLIILLLIFVLRRAERKKFWGDKVTIAFLLLFTLIPLATIILKGEGNWYAFAEFSRMFLIPMTIFLLLRASNMTGEEFNSFLRAMTILGIFMAVVSIQESWLPGGVIVPPWIGNPGINDTIGGGRAGGLIMQSEFNGLALALIVVLIFIKSVNQKKSFSFLQYAAVSLGLIGLYLTYTRSVWVSVILGFVILLNGMLTARISPAIKIGSTSLFVVAIIIAILIPSPMAKSRFEDSGTINYRLHLWARSIQMGMERPFFGHGITQFESSVAEYKSNLSSMPEMFIPKIGTGTHNLILNLLVEQGIVGLALFAMIIYRFFRIVGRNLSRLDRNREKYWIYALAAVYFINAQFINMHEPTTNMIYYGALGILAGLDTIPLASGKGSKGLKRG
jgi:O-antigen ligase